MTPSEAVALTRYVKACCPQQQIDDYTPDAWYDLLGDLTADDCLAAVKVVCKRQPFIAPAEIRAEVRRVRADRLARAIPPVPAHELADKPGRYKAALDAGIRKIADGRSLHLAIASPVREGDPPADWTEARRKRGEALEASARALTPQEIARRQVAESRAARDATQTPEAGTGEPG